jgi:spoIIIJ-associated protein
MTTGDPPDARIDLGGSPVSAPQQPTTDTDLEPVAEDPTEAPEADVAGAETLVAPDVDADETEADETEADETEEADEADEEDLLVREGDVAGDYLERLLDILDVDGDIDLDVEGDRASVAIVGGRLDDLVGQDGAVLDALQELTRLAVAQSTGVRSRLMLDVGGFRAKRRAELSALAGKTAERVAQSRQPERLAPMNPFERKVVHDVIAGVAGVRSESEGEEPNRRVVVLPDQ